MLRRVETDAASIETSIPREPACQSSHCSPLKGSSARECAIEPNDLEPPPAFDLLVRAGRVVCPATGLDASGAVAIRGDRIVAAGVGVHGPARTMLDFPHGILLPGLIDLHAHPSRQGSRFGVDPDVELLPQGTTTVLSQGDAGAAGWPAFRETTIAASRSRVRLAINLSTVGESAARGCLENLADLDVPACVAAIEEAGELIWGIAINVSHVACGATDPRFALRLALDVAERTGKPLLYGMRRPEEWSFAEQMARLRPGDVVTYCYRREPHCIVEQGRVHPVIRGARERGILFDVGHGRGSFDFPTAEAALADNFAPDTISTDYQLAHVGMRPQHSLPRTMAKLLAAGMAEKEVFAAVTSRPAAILGLQAEIGTLSPGSCADLAVLVWDAGAPALADVYGGVRPGGCWKCALVVREGRVILRQAPTKSTEDEQKVD